MSDLHSEHGEEEEDVALVAAGPKQVLLLPTMLI